MEKSANQRVKNRKTMHWGWIIFWIIVFWPVGIYFVIQKFSCDKTAILNKGRTILPASLLLILFGAVGLSIFFDGGDGYDLGVAIAFLVGGIYLLWLSISSMRKGKRFKRYIGLIVNQSQDSLDQIAGIIKQPYDRVAKDLQEMIDKDYFTGSHIDYQKRQFVFICPNTPLVNAREVVVNCKHCGAVNKGYEGQVTKCEYCDSYLQG